MDEILTEAQDAQFKLEQTPGSTIDYVEHLTFVDEVQDRIEVLDDRTAFVTGMYELIEQYKVPTSPEDLAIFKVRSLLEFVLFIQRLGGLSKLLQ